MTSPAGDNCGPHKLSTNITKSAAESGSTGTPHKNTNSSLSAMLGLDRKAMEAERLARAQARKRQLSLSPPPRRKAPKFETEIIEFESGAVLKSITTAIDSEQERRKPEIADVAKQQPNDLLPVKQEPDAEVKVGSPLSSQANLKYPDGVVKRTWAFGHDRTGDDVRLEEVLEPLTLRTAVLSSFQWDLSWVIMKLKTPLKGGSTKCELIMPGKESHVREGYTSQTEKCREFLRLSFPPMIGQTQCMHSKLQLLFHEHKLRVVVPSSNLIDLDWGETGLMENTVFMIDLPRRRQKEPQRLTWFAKELLFFLQKKSIYPDALAAIHDFDFSATKDMAFVHSVGGVHYGADAERTGLHGLSNAVRRLGLCTQDGLELDFAASSIGSLNDQFLKNVHAAARGQCMLERASSASAAGKTNFFQSTSTTSAASEQHIRDKFRIYFPTKDTVSKSTAGFAGSIFCTREWFERETFPRACFREYRSTRSGLLSHNKILYARGKQQGKDVAWVYVGSANMSESAWGKIVYDKRAKQYKINCRNWECGVLLPVPAGKLQTTRALAKGHRLGDWQTPRGVEGREKNAQGWELGRSSSASASEESTLVGMDVFDQIFKPPFETKGDLCYGTKQPFYVMEALE